MRKYIRMCPNCGNDIIYKKEKYLNSAEKNNSKCKSCSATLNNSNPKTKEKIRNSNIGRKHSDETKRKISISKTGHIVSNETREKISKYNKGKKLTPEHKEKIRSSLMGHFVSDETKIKIGLKSKGRYHTKASKDKIRMSVIKVLKDRYGKNIFPLYNPKACKIIEEYGKKNGYNFQHALNGGEFHIEELGYWVDGYDKDKNVVIEYYESHHNNKKKID